MTVMALAFAALLWLFPAPAGAQPRAADLACHQEPGNRFYWLERAFCDLGMHGPERAHGVVIWNHGISGTLPAWRAPAPPVFRLLQERGWDVIMIKRHNLAETMPGGPLYRTVERTLQEVTAQRKLGYRKVVLAGQSFGGYVTLDAIDTSPDLFAAIAMSPGVRSSSAGGALDPTITERILGRARVGRLAVVFPKNDTLFGSIVRGERAQAILARRPLPYLMVDETTEIAGHGGGTTGRFALRYGLCLSEFLSAPTLPTGRFTCPTSSDDWSVVRELLMPKDDKSPRFLLDASAAPGEIGLLLGPRWALLGDTIVLVAPVDGPSGPRLMYRSTGSGGGTYEATIIGGSMRAVLPNKSSVTLSPENEGTITWVSSDGSSTLKAPLVRGLLP